MGRQSVWPEFASASAKTLSREAFSEEFLRPAVRELLRRYLSGEMTADDWGWWQRLGGPALAKERAKVGQC